MTCDGTKLLVCAPTNKAVTVLATKFMKAMVDPDQCPYNVLIIGEADKLFEEERKRIKISKGQTPSKSQHLLESVFINSWLLIIIKDYYKIKNYPFTNKKQTRRSMLTPESLHKLACTLERKLRSRLVNLPEDIMDKAALISCVTGAIKAGLQPALDDESIITISELLSTLNHMNKEKWDVVHDDLTSSADVLFCTLVSAGGLCLKKHSVSDVIVDEAAAATEPTLYIPFHLKPMRMVGTATVCFIAKMSCI